tara:strand:- start:3016 stop:3324 length:309 start_codon:yes stop_codon:yes gene_type:complete
MNQLTNKVPLYLFEQPSGPLITIKAGSKLEIKKINESYHAYYELHSYGINVSLDKKNYVIACTRHKDTKCISVGSTTNFTLNSKPLNWEETFKEDCKISTRF